MDCLFSEFRHTPPVFKDTIHDLPLNSMAMQDISTESGVNFHAVVLYVLMQGKLAQPLKWKAEHVHHCYCLLHWWLLPDVSVCATKRLSSPRPH